MHALAPLHRRIRIDAGFIRQRIAVSSGDGRTRNRRNKPGSGEHDAKPRVLLYRRGSRPTRLHRRQRVYRRHRHPRRRLLRHVLGSLAANLGVAHLALEPAHVARMQGHHLSRIAATESTARVLPQGDVRCRQVQEHLPDPWLTRLRRAVRRTRSAHGHPTETHGALLEHAAARAGTS